MLTCDPLCQNLRQKVFVEWPFIEWPFIEWLFIEWPLIEWPFIESRFIEWSFILARCPSRRLHLLQLSVAIVEKTRDFRNLKFNHFII